MCFLTNYATYPDTSQCANMIDFLPIPTPLLQSMPHFAHPTLEDAMVYSGLEQYKRSLRPAFFVINLSISNLLLALSI